MNKATASKVLFASGLLHGLAWIKRRLRGEKLLVLSFHCVSDPAERYFRPGMNIDRGDFAALLDGLSKHYRFGSLKDAVADRAEPTAVVTFDDAYRSVYDHAYPVLRERHIPATLFVPTDYIESGKLLWWDVVKAAHPEDADARIDRLKYLPMEEREQELAGLDTGSGSARLMMDWNQIRELSENGFEIGSHTASHPYLDAMDQDAMRADLERAHNAIAEHTGTAPTSLAYPDGRFNAAVVDELKRLGYACAVSTMSGTNRADTDPFALRRHDGSQSFGSPFSFPLAWAELLGFWDTVLLRRLRNPERYTTYRPNLSNSAR